MRVSRFPVFSVAVALLLLSVTLSTGIAQATTTVTENCYGTSGMERAQCLVQQHMNMLRSLGRLPAGSSSSVASSSNVSSMEHATSASSVATEGCSRKFADARGLCLAQKRKDQLAHAQQQHAVNHGPPIRNTPHCERFNVPAERLKCLQALHPMAAGASSSH